jgi:hypothetical protein
MRPENIELVTDAATPMDRAQDASVCCIHDADGFLAWAKPDSVWLPMTVSSPAR